jgi:hypothetical protein
MCTLAVALRTDRRWPVIVAANRDERLGRASEGWALRTTSPPNPPLHGEPWRGGQMGVNVAYAAPRDQVAGGTWIGISARGVFAGLTNYHAPLDWYPDPARRTRGELVPLALSAPDAASARALVAGLDLAAWNPFHLVVADAQDAFLAWYDGEGAGVEPLPDGLHVVTESSLRGLGPRGDLVRARWPVEPSVPRLRELLTIHAPEPVTAQGSLGVTCIHMDPHYGTRSSAILRLAPALAGDRRAPGLGASELYVTDARPCLAPHEDRSALLHALAARGA